MSPDFAYYIRQILVARYAHTILGTFTVCLPTGLLALGIFYLLREPLCFVLPQPHRAALMPLASVRPRISLRSILIAAVSVLLGAWSHTLWDSFTHDGAWSVQHFPILRVPLIHVGSTELPASYILQQLSTFGAGAALALMYFLWLRRQPIAPPPAQGAISDVWRYLIFVLLAVIALSVAAPTAFQMASLFEGYTAFRVFVFRTGIYAAAVFIPLPSLTSIIFYAVHRRRLTERL